MGCADTLISSDCTNGAKIVRSANTDLFEPTGDRGSDVPELLDWNRVCHDVHTSLPEYAEAYSALG
jgi:hypothetical protein